MLYCIPHLIIYLDNVEVYLMEYVAIVISSLALIAIIVAIVLIVKNNNKKVEAPQLDLKEIGALQQQLNSLNDQLKTNIELAVSKEINKVLEQMN